MHIENESNNKVLIVEDDVNISELLELHLKDMDFQIEVCSDGKSGLHSAFEKEFDLIILDLMLPKMDGIELCKQIREKNKTVPIIMLTAKSEEMDKVLGLELGADDYITKPFSVRELLARIKALLRRQNRINEEESTVSMQLQFEGLIIDLDKRKVKLYDKTIELTSKEFELLALFARNPGKTYSRYDLLNLIWGYQFNGYEHTVNSHINRLRNKIETDPANPKFLKTVWGVGYRFAEIEELV